MARRATMNSGNLFQQQGSNSHVPNRLYVGHRLSGLGARCVPSRNGETLPPTPTLPPAAQSGYAPVNGIRIWYATFGRGEPVILLHGGLVNANWWGNLVRELQKHYRVIVMDSRGHGRSTRNADPFGYDLMASDVIGLMDILKIPEAALVGWSDGAIVGLDIAMKHPERLTKLFAFAANSDPSGVADVASSPVFAAAIARAEKEYEKLSPTPGEFPAFVAQITRMWETQPNWTADDLKKITVPTWIVDGDHDEMIKRENTRIHGRADTRCRSAVAAGGKPFLDVAGPRAVHVGRAPFPAARESTVSGIDGGAKR